MLVIGRLDDTGPTALMGSLAIYPWGVAPGWYEPGLSALLNGAHQLQSWRLHHRGSEAREGKTARQCVFPDGIGPACGTKLQRCFERRCVFWVRFAPDDVKSRTARWTRILPSMPAPWLEFRPSGGSIDIAPKRKLGRLLVVPAAEVFGLSSPAHRAVISPPSSSVQRSSLYQVAEAVAAWAG